MGFITAFEIAIFASAIISTVLSMLVYRKRASSQPLRFLSGMFFANAVYATSYLFEIISPGLKGAIFFLNLEYLGLSFIPVFWILIAWSYKPQDLKSEQEIVKQLQILYIIPVLICLFVWTNGWHRLVYHSLTLQENLPITAIKFDRATGFWIINATIIILYLSGSIRMVYNLVRAKGSFRTQYLLLMLATVLPIFTHLLLLKQVVPYNLDIVPISFTLSGLLLYWGMAKMQLFDLVPIARTMVLNAMHEAVFVLDNKHRLIDSNHQARELFLQNDAGVYGKTLSESHPQLWDSFTNASQAGEVVLPVDGKQRTFTISKSPITDKRQENMGMLYLLHDITELRSYVKELERLAASDGLTGLLNHRQFMELATEEATRLEQVRNGMFSLIIFDLDNFKEINDTYGHSAGDLALQKVGQLVAEHARPSDLCARYGGEEFILLCRGTSLSDAFQFAEELRLGIAETSIPHGGQPVGITASFGVSIYSPHMGISWETALNQADTAMYTAKANGRNCTVPGTVLPICIQN
ncbi:MAG: hypothetical protein CVV52_15430 [Spirochaetae bacterium HGW-Spirochaetae-8]|nr:MAG: hypothetical protein CVV52_15430 [Spirochaetae bacterium HGW-Spirochaetae-8]